MRLRATERVIALIRISVVAFNIVTYLWLSPTDSPSSLAVLIIALAPIYAGVAYAAASRSDRRIHEGDTSGIVTLALSSMITDTALIALWLFATGGYDSPYYLLYHASAAASMGRFGIVIGGVSTVAGALSYLAVLVIDGGGEAYNVSVRIGYMFVIAAFSGFLIETVRRSERDTFRAEAAARSFREVDDLKSAFVANVSHELRTPLTVIRGASSTLSRKHDELGEDQRRALLDMIERHATHFGRLIQDLLDFAVSNRGEMRVSMSMVDLRELIRSEIEEAAKTTPQSITLAEGGALEFWCDGQKVSRAFLSLLSNASKFSPADSTIEVSVTEDAGGGARISVRDRGKGIPAELQEKIFDSFYMVDQKPEGGAEGTGIGLHVARELVRLHGGDVEVVSVPGRGSTFSIVLPLLGEQQPEGVTDSLSV